MTLGVLMRVMSGAEAGSEDPCGPGEGRGQPGRGEGGALAICGREFWGPGGPSVVNDERSSKQRTGALRLWPGRLLEAP